MYVKPGYVSDLKDSKYMKKQNSLFFITLVKEVNDEIAVGIIVRGYWR